ncbi:MAG: hypothetical protein OXG24_03915 [Gammaproteobacteria bacterium]|nr:hypothetical protein [Gammaproteobacteria bacterium]
MSQDEFGSTAIKIGIVLAIIGGVFGVVESAQGIVSAITLYSLLERLTAVLLSVAGILVLSLSVAIVWFAILSIRTPNRKYGWTLIFCSTGPIALNLLLAILITALVFADSSATNTDQRMASFAVEVVVRAIGDYIGFMALGLIGGILIVVGTGPKNVTESIT